MIELILDDDEAIGVEAISVVESPAIESDFIALNNHEIKLAEISKEKRLLIGALLIPNKPIYRRNGEDEYYVFFSADTIEKASEMYLENGNQKNSTLEHDGKLEGLTLVQSWIKSDMNMDKSNIYGLDVPVGTWMAAVKVNNDDVWNNYVKTGKIKGFSIEGYFADKLESKKADLKEELREYPHFMYDPKTGKKVEVNTKEEHERYTKQGYVHSKSDNYDEDEALINELIKILKNE
jgi:hypothetical protein